MSATDPHTMLTKPDAAERCGVRIDRLRKILIRRPDLEALFVTVGPLRLLPANRLDELKAGVAREGERTCPGPAPRVPTPVAYSAAASAPCTVG